MATSAAAATGADLLWRAKGNAVLPVLERYPDGSFRSELVASDDKHTRADVLTVRVIEYAIDDPGRPGATDTKYRLITTIMDPEQAPADELAALYAERWEIESIFDELKTHQRGPRVILRSRTPEGVYQEAWGYLCVHYALRALIHGAAHDHDHDLDPDPDPDRISFTAALHAACRSIRTGLSDTVNLASALRRATSELLHGLLRKRQLRANARVVCRKMSNYNVKRAQHRNWPTPGIPVGSAIAFSAHPKLSVLGLALQAVGTKIAAHAR